jgi:hypothetical protein
VSEFDLLDRRERALCAEADMLDKEIAELRRQRGLVEEKLQQVARVRTDLKELLAQEADSTSAPAEDRPGHGSGPDVDDVASNADATDAEPEEAPGSSGPGSGPHVRLGIKEAQARVVNLLTTSGRKMRARAIAEAIGEDVSTPGRVETTRGRLKTLVSEGVLEEEPVEKVLRHAEAKKDYEFLAPEDTVFDAIGLFEDASRKGRRLNAILLTSQRSRHGRPRGIITIFDMPALRQAALGSRPSWTTE